MKCATTGCSGEAEKVLTVTAEIMPGVSSAIDMNLCRICYDKITGAGVKVSMSSRKLEQPWQEEVVNSTANFKAGDRVRYIPDHAHGDPGHRDCAVGIVKRVNDVFVFVNYIRNNVIHETAEATNPRNLVVEAV